MNLKPRMKPYEVLEVAVKSEIEAANLYSRIHNRVKNETLRKKLEFLIVEEKKHRRILERLFNQRFSGRKLEIPERSFLPPIPLGEIKKLSVVDLFKAALKAEKTSEDFYKSAQKTAEDKQSQKLLEYLSRVERSHYFMVKSEIDLLGRFPGYYDVQDFHYGQEMVHVGP